MGTTGTGGETGTGGKVSTGGSGGSATGGSGGSATGGQSGTGGTAGAVGTGGSRSGPVGRAAGTEEAVPGATALAERQGRPDGRIDAGSGGAGGHGGGQAWWHAGGGASGAAGGSGNKDMPCPTTAGTACAILPLGDSITEGWLPTSGVGGYRVELFTKAVLAGKNITFVGSQTSSSAPNTVQNQTFSKKHEGHDGYTIDTGSGNSGISGSITDQAMSNYHPNIVLLMIGTNDTTATSTSPMRRRGSAN